MLERLEDGDIIECYIYNNGESDWFSYKDGVFNKTQQVLVLTSGGIFDFNNNSLHNVSFRFNTIGNVNKHYHYNQEKVTLKKLLDYLMIENGMDDLSFKIYGNSDADIGYFEDFPANIVEIRNGFISMIAFSRDSLNQQRLNWLYYLKDKNVNIEI